MMMSKRKKIWLWIAGILGTLVLLIGGVAIYLSSQWKPLLSEKLKEGVHQASGGLYQLNFKDVRLNLVRGSVEFDDVTLNADTVVWEQVNVVSGAPRHIFNIRLAKLKMTGIQVLTAYLKKDVNVGAIVLQEPSIDMIYKRGNKKRIDSSKVELTLYQQLSKTLKSIRVAKIKVIDANFDYFRNLEKLNSIKHLSIDVSDVLIDSLAQFDTTRVFHSKNIGFSLAGYQSETKDKLYTIKLDSLQGSISSRTLHLKGLKLVPRYAELKFSRQYKTQKDRYDLNFSTIDLSGFDFTGLNADGELRVKNITVGPAKVAVFLNRELALLNINKARNFPHNALKRLEINTKVDTVKLKNVDIAYTEYNPKNKEKGTLRLDNLSGRIFNLTNDSISLVKNHFAKADLSTFLLGKAKMNVSIKFNLVDSRSAFQYSGSLAPFNMQILNPLSVSLGQVRIESGYVNAVNFNISANEAGSNGTVNFRYNNLKIKLLEESDEGKTQKKKLLSFLANQLLVKNDNPAKGEEVRSAKINWTREPQASFFNLMWKSVFVGIREIVGIGVVPIKKMAKQEEERRDEVKKKMEEKKEKLEKKVKKG